MGLFLMLRKDPCSEAAHAMQNPKVTLAALVGGVCENVMNDESSRTAARSGQQPKQRFVCCST